MRAYTVDAAAFALDVPTKWLDNLLSHHAVPGVGSGRQGVQRRLSVDSLVIVALARSFHRELGASLGMAVRLASAVASRPDGDVVLNSADATSAGTLRLIADVAAVRSTLEARLREGVEFGAAPRRGRPPRRRV